jgi:tRNA(Ile)-lysidine synthase
VLKKINPSISTSFIYSQKRLLGVEQLLNERVEEVVNQYFEEGEIDRLDTTWITDANRDLTILHEILERYGMSFKQASQVFLSIFQESGAVFHWDQFELNVDRDQLFITKNEKINLSEVIIQEYDLETSFLGYSYEITQSDDGVARIIKNAEIACLDFDKLRFPLKLRVWSQGDSFFPLGMQHKKKVSDFLIDLKIPRILKDKIVVVESEGKICWIAGYRVDDRFSIKENTTKALYIKKIKSV